MKKLINILKFVVFFALALFLLWLAFRGIEFNKITENILKANFWWVLLAMIAAWLAFIVRAWRWNILIEPIAKAPSLRNSYHAVMIGYLANFAFPRLGEITRCGTLNNTDKIPLDKLFGTVIMERIFDMLVLVLLIFIVVISKINFFGKFLNDMIFHPFINKISGVISGFHFLILIVVFFLVCGLVLFYFRKKIQKNVFIKKVLEFLKGIFIGLKSVRQIKQVWMFAVLTIALWLFYFLQAYLIFFSFSFTAELTPIDGLFVLILSGLAVVAPVQGGIGAFHFIVSLGLTLYGITREDGLVYATVSHGSSSIFTILLGFVSLILLYYNRRKILKQ